MDERAADGWMIGMDRRVLTGVGCGNGKSSAQNGLRRKRAPLSGSADRFGAFEASRRKITLFARVQSIILWPAVSRGGQRLCPTTIPYTGRVSVPRPPPPHSQPQGAKELRSRALVRASAKFHKRELKAKTATKGGTLLVPLPPR